MSVIVASPRILLPHLCLTVMLSIVAASAAENLENLTAKATAYEAQERYEEAELVYQQALKAASDDLVRAKIGSHLASVYERDDRYADAERMFRSALQWRRQALPRSSVEVSYSLNNLAELYHAQGRDWEARNLLESSVDNLERFHPEAEGLPVILGNLAIVQCRFGELQRAEELLRRALESYEGDGRESRNFAVTLSDMAQVLQLKEEFHAAAPLYEQAIGIFERLGQPNTVDLAATLADEGTLYMRLGQIEESRQAELRALELLPASSNRALRAQVLRSLGNVEARGAHPSDSLP